MGNDSGTIWIGNVSVTELKAEDGVDHDMKKSPLSDGNRIYNGTFDQGMQRMAFWHVENMTVTIPDVVIAEDGTEDYSRAATLSNAVSEAAKMYQNGILVSGGCDYRISMDIAANEPVALSVALLGTDKKTLYATNTFSYNKGGETVTMEYFFTVPEGVNDNEAEFRISLSEGAEVTIDNVRLEECELETVPENNKME